MTPDAAFTAFLVPRRNAAHRAPPRALLVSADREVSRSLVGVLAVEGLELDRVTAPEAAWHRFSVKPPTLLLADLDLGTSVLGLLAFVHKTQPQLPCLALAAPENRSAAVHALRLGASSYALKPVLSEEVTLLVGKAMNSHRLQARLSECRAQCRSFRFQLAEQRMDFHARQLEVALRLVSAVQSREGESAAHVERVAAVSAILGEELGWQEEDLSELRTAAALHDVGMIALPDEILRKTGPLTGRELGELKTHPQSGAEILGNSSLSVLKTAREVALGHHERWDGSGYPHGLKGEDIPPSARIVALADVYDALQQPRSYRPPMAEEECLAYIGDQKGKAFDPRVVDCFIDVLPRLRKVQQEMASALGA